MEKNGRKAALASAFLASVVLVLFGLQASAQESYIKAGGFEDQSASLYWDQESLAGNNLIQEMPDSQSHSGRGIARLGGTRTTVDTLDQFLGLIPGYYSGLTLSFYCRTSRVGGPKRTADRLSVSLLDSNSGQQYLLGTVAPQYPDWTLISFPLAGLVRGNDYTLHFEAWTGSSASSTTFDLDDVSLAQATQALLPIDPPEPPDTLPDEQGDVPHVNTPAHTAEITGTLHRDLPNPCSCQHLTHQSITITTSGFSTLTGAVVKFKLPTAATLKNATITNITGNVITCTVPDAPTDKNYLGAAQIKVKVGTEKTWVSDYSVDNSTGVETGFWYGFPDPIRNVQLQSTTAPSILGGDPFQITATGMSIFTKWRSTLSVCGTRDQDYIRPFIYLYPYQANDPKNTTDLKQKVRVQRSAIQNTCGTNTWSSSWTGDGAPTLCNEATPCIRLNDANAPQTLVFLNPDNIANESTNDWRQYTWRKGWHAGIATNLLALSLPASPAFAPGTSYGPANSVGYGYNGATPVNVAIRPLNSASNSMTFHGSSLYRFNHIENNDQPLLPWIQADMNGATWESGSGWGATFIAWALAHSPASAITPYLATKDMALPTLNGVPFEYKSSFAAVGSSRACLANPTAGNCDITIVATSFGTWNWGDVEFFMVGPQENTAVSVNSPCYSGSCGYFSLSPTKSVVSTDGQGRPTMKVQLGYTMQQNTPHGSSASFTLSVTSGYGTIESRNVVIMYY